MWLPLRAAHASAAIRRARARRRAARAADAAVSASYVIHAGAVIVIVAIAVSSTMRTSQEVHAATAARATTVAGYTRHIHAAPSSAAEPHRTSTHRADFDVAEERQAVATLEPRMNQYAAMREPIGTPDVYSTLDGRLYLSIMNLDPGDRGRRADHQPRRWSAGSGSPSC